MLARQETVSSTLKYMYTHFLYFYYWNHSKLLPKSASIKVKLHFGEYKFVDKRQQNIPVTGSAAIPGIFFIIVNNEILLEYRTQTLKFFFYLRLFPIKHLLYQLHGHNY